MKSHTDHIVDTSQWICNELHSLLPLPGLAVRSGTEAALSDCNQITARESAGPEIALEFLKAVQRAAIELQHGDTPPVSDKFSTGGDEKNLEGKKESIN
jgi:hypothetical protein